MAGLKALTQYYSITTKKTEQLNNAYNAHTTFPTHPTHTNKEVIHG